MTVLAPFYPRGDQTHYRCRLLPCSSGEWRIRRGRMQYSWSDDQLVATSCPLRLAGRLISACRSTGLTAHTCVLIFRHVASHRQHVRVRSAVCRYCDVADRKVVDRPSNNRRGTLDMIDLTVVLVVSSLRSLNALTVVMVTVVMGDGLRKSPAASTTISFLQSRNEHLTL